MTATPAYGQIQMRCCQPHTDTWRSLKHPVYNNVYSTVFWVLTASSTLPLILQARRQKNNCTTELKVRVNECVYARTHAHDTAAHTPLTPTIAHLASPELCDSECNSLYLS